MGSHIDTIALRLPRDAGAALDYLPELRKLERLAYSVRVMASGRGDAPARHSRVLIHRPREAAFAIADGLIDRYRGAQQEVHVALEVAADDIFDAERKSIWLARRLRRRWGRDPWNFRVGDELGEYGTSANRWPVDRRVVYPASSKLEVGAPCVRLERRVTSVPLVGRVFRGILHPSDLLARRPIDFWTETLSFEEVDFVQLGRQERGRGRAKLPDLTPLGTTGRHYDNDEAVGAIIARRAALRFHEPWTEGSSQAVRAECRGEPWFNPRTCIKPIASPLVITAGEWLFPR